MPWQRHASAKLPRTARVLRPYGFGSTVSLRSEEQTEKRSMKSCTSTVDLQRRTSADARRTGSQLEFNFPRGAAASTIVKDSRTALKHLEAHSIFWNHSNLLRMNRSASQSFEAGKLEGLKLRFGQKVLDQPGISLQYLSKLKKDSSKRIN